MKSVLSVVLYVVACAFVVAAALLMLLVLSLVSSSVATTLGTPGVALSVTRLLPGWFALWGVLPSPLGGVFRSDLLVVALLMLVIGKVIRRLGKGL